MPNLALSGDWVEETQVEVVQYLLLLLDLY